MTYFLFVSHIISTHHS